MPGAFCLSRVPGVGTDLFSSVWRGFKAFADGRDAWTKLGARHAAFRLDTAAGSCIVQLIGCEGGGQLGMCLWPSYEDFAALLRPGARGEDDAIMRSNMFVLLSSGDARSPDAALALRLGLPAPEPFCGSRFPEATILRRGGPRLQVGAPVGGVQRACCRPPQAACNS
jgi:hypothetical protein